MELVIIIAGSPDPMKAIHLWFSQGQVFAATRESKERNVMSKIAGIIAEYNPFHRGHQYQLEETRRQTGADYIIVVMSGNFVQRGEPALFEKSLRVQMALLGGADLVLELPAPFASGSAEDFASGAISLLNGLGCVDYLSFGSESGRLAPLREAAAILASEPAMFSDTLKKQLSNGVPYPKAQAAALTSCKISQESLTLLKEPNNLLATEYLKAIIRQKSPLQPIAIRRLGCGYHELQTEHIQNFASASGLRSVLLQEQETARRKTQEIPWQVSHSTLSQIPKDLHPIYQAGQLFPIRPDDISLLFHYQLLTCMERGIPLREFSDISSELEGRLKRQAFLFQPFSQRIQALKTKQYTYTRISRALLHMTLNIRQEDMDFYRRKGYCSYARILGFWRRSSPLFSHIKKQSTIPVIAKASDAPKKLSEKGRKLWNQDCYCSHIYQAILQQAYPNQITAAGPFLTNEYSRPLVIL